MAAILGTLSVELEDVCAQASEEAGLVVPANFNSADQVVISGEIAGVERAMELAKAAGAKRALRLPVSGAFHSPLMAPAAPGLEAMIGTVAVDDPAFPVYANVTAAPVTSGAVARELLVKQLTSPVRWQQVMQSLASGFPDATFVELGTGNVLTGLAKRIAPSVRTMTCGTPAEIEQLIQLSSQV
jgi:[acyl-carrier-protein] S-malonyltransferase